jgi:uncharacterized protein
MTSSQSLVPAYGFSFNVFYSISVKNTTMDIIIISIAAFLTSLLTFFSGFGLGTILTPVFVFFFPVEIAIALTGVVHFTNNVFKLGLIGKFISKDVLLRFGLPAIAASFFGAWLLLKISVMPVLFKYSINDKIFEVSPVNLIIAILLFVFAVLELTPSFQSLQFERNKLPFGGILSGFFGGLTGIQGAIRSAFLIKSGLSKETYIATGVGIACLIDISRLSVYASGISTSNLTENKALLVSATLSAIAGAFIGRKLLKKVTLKFVQTIVAILLIIISIALGLGMI